MSKMEIPMKTTLKLLVLLLLCSSFTVYARRKPKVKDYCEVMDIETDAFGKTTRKAEISFDWNKYRFALIEVNGKLGFYITSTFTSIVETVLPTDSPVRFAMEDGSILEIKSIASSQPSKVVSAYGVFTRWEQEFAVNEDVLKSFSISRIKAIQLIVNTKEVTVELSEDEGEEILDAVKCLLMNPPVLKTEE